MIKIYDRQQFVEYWEEIKPGLGQKDSVLWTPEQSLAPDGCQHFICISPIPELWHDEYIEFWSWCGDQLKGHCRCFSSSTNPPEEWWGFTDKDDILMWVLRWAK